MTLTSILKRLNQSTPFDEEQFKGFLQDILGWNEFTIARENLPVLLHEATEEFSRLYTSKRSTTYVWILKLKRQNPHAEQALLDFIAQKESDCIVVIRYPEVKNWKLGWVSLVGEQSQYRWMDIGNEYTNHTWAQLLLNQQARTAGTFKSHFQQTQLHNILLSRVKQWKRYTLNNLHHSSSAGTFNGSMELCIELFLQVFVLTIIEKKGWLGISETVEWGSGSKQFLLSEWNRIHPRGENYWLSVLRPLLLAIESNGQMSSRYNDIRLPPLNLHITKDITDFAIPNSIFWDPQYGLLSILYAFPIELNSPGAHSILHINEGDLRALLEDTLSRGGKNEYKGYHTPSVLGETLNRQALEAYLLSQIQIDESLEDNKLLSKAVSVWIQTGDLSEHVRFHAHRLSQWLQSIQLCDPAMGAGALLVSMMKLITTLCCELDGTRKPHKLKYSLLQKNLFGVDTNALSLSAAKVSLWLCWVTERRHPKPFPNLEGNLIHANSIIDEPFEISLWNEASMPLELSSTDLPSPFAESIIALRNGLMHDLKAYPLSDQPALRINEIEDKQWKLSLLHANHPLDSNDVQSLKQVPEMACIWPWRFPNVFIHEHPGFDIVICNPPFMSEETNRDLFLDLKNQSSLREWYNGRMDLLYYFVFRAIQITKDEGIISLLTNDFWTKASGAQRLRQHLKSSLHLTHWLHFGEYNDVEVASRQHNLLVSLCKRSPKDDDQTFVYSINFKRNVLDWLTANAYIPYIQTSTKLLYHSSQVTMQFVDEKAWGNILDKISHHHSPLNELASLHQGLVTGANQSTEERELNKKRGIFVLQSDNDYDATVIQQLKKEDPTILKPLRKNSEIKSFSVETSVERYVLYLYRGLDISADTHPALMTHLQPYYNRLKNRREVYKGSIDWWCLSWPRTEAIFSPNTIVTPYRSPTFRFAQNKHGYHYSSDCTMIVPDEAKIHPLYLLGYLNSTVFECWYRLKGKNKGSLLEFLTSPLQEVPIPLCHPRAEKDIVEIVQSIESKVSSSSKLPPLSGHIKAIDAILFRALDLSLSEQRRLYKYVNLFSKIP